MAARVTRPIVPLSPPGAQRLTRNQIKERERKEAAAKTNATVLKCLTIAFTLFAVAGMGYFGIHTVLASVAKPTAGVITGSQFLGGACSAVGSTLGTYFYLSRKVDWDNGEIKTSDVAKLIGLLGLGFGGFGLALFGVGSAVQSLAYPVGGGVGALVGYKIFSLKDRRAKAKKEEEEKKVEVDELEKKQLELEISNVIIKLQGAIDRSQVKDILLNQTIEIEPKDLPKLLKAAKRKLSEADDAYKAVKNSIIDMINELIDTGKIS